MRGYQEEGTTTTPFDMAMLNGIDRFQLAIDAIDRVPGLSAGIPCCASRCRTAACVPATIPANSAKTRSRSAGGPWLPQTRLKTATRGHFRPIRSPGMGQK